MDEQKAIKTLKDIVIRFSGDSGDGMQLTGTIPLKSVPHKARSVVSLDTKSR